MHAAATHLHGGSCCVSTGSCHPVGDRSPRVWDTVVGLLEGAVKPQALLALLLAAQFVPPQGAVGSKPLLGQQGGDSTAAVLISKPLRCSEPGKAHRSLSHSLCR